MEASRPMLRIFVGCTSRDLEQHRDAVRRLIEKFDGHAVVMENFGARDGGATQVSLERLLSCDLYILLLAWRYGTIPTIPPDETLSVTHLEYRAAKDAGMPRLIFLANPATEKDDGPDALFPATVRDDEHVRQVRAFRDEVGHDRVAAFFTTPESAALEVAVALHHFLHVLAPTLPQQPLSLAPRAPEFVGRASELTDLCQRLRSGQSVGLSALVSGLGGIGKSALAAEALATLAAQPDAFPGGVTFVRCDGREGLPGLAWLYDQLLADWGAPLAPEQVAQAQVAGPEAEVELRERALQARLRDSAPALALLDNVEVGLPLARVLDTFSAFHLTALVTARHTPTVARLAVVRLDVLDPAAAAQLFAERFREKGGEWDEARDAAATSEVVERLGWLPLAIELQAARAALRQVSVTQLNADLDRDRSQGLLGDPTDATRNLRYSFAQSLRALTPLQRTRFAALGLPGGPDWPRTVIERLLAGIQERDTSSGADETGEPSASEIASSQADLDLLLALSLINPAEGRIRLHPLLREFARELWQSQPQDTQAQGLRALLTGIGEFVTVHRHDFAALENELGTIASAVDRAYTMQIAHRRVILIVALLTDYLLLGGQWHLGMHLFSWQLAMARAIGDQSAKCFALNRLGSLTRSLGQLEESRVYFEQALSTEREMGDRNSESVTLNNLGMLLDELGDKEQARAYYEQALVIAQGMGYRSGEGTILNNLGAIVHELGDKEQALSYYQQALPVLREVGNRNIEGAILNNLGYLADSLGQPDEACSYFEQALTIAREVGNRDGEGTALNNLGYLADSLGDKEQARAYYEQAISIAQEIGAISHVRITTGNLAYLDSESAVAPSNNPPDAAPPSLPAVKPSARKRRWPWRR